MIATATAFATLDGAYPVVGHMPEMYRGFPALCARGERKHGPLFFVEGGPGARQLVCARAGALDVLKHADVSTGFYADGFGALLSGTLFAFDGAEHRHVRGLMAPAFTPKRLRRTDVWSIIADTAQRHIERWIAEARPFSALTATKELTLEIIFRVIGVPGEDIAAWRRKFGHYLLAGFPNNSRLKGPVHWVAANARDWLDERLLRLVTRLRREGDDGSLVAAIAHQRDDEGRHLDAELIVPNLRLLVLAGHETTASALAFNLLHLARSAQHQRRARREAEAAGDLVERASSSDGITFAEMQFRENLRLYPAVHSVIRRLERDVTLFDRRVGRGTLLNVPLCHLLRHPDGYERPDRYEPERWTRRPRPGSIETAMFGGGPHFCLGYHIAIAEGTLINLCLARALAAHDLALTARGPMPEPIYLPLTHPPQRAKVCLSRR